MRLLLLWVATATIALFGCSEETIVKEAPVREGSVIELVTFGSAENPTAENKGFSPGYYCYLNLETDSVYIQHKLNNDDVPKTIARAGYIAGLSEHPAIIAYTGSSKHYKSGELITPKTPEGTLYCGPTFYTNYRHAGKEKIHYFTYHKLNVGYVLFTDFVFSLVESEELEPVNTFVPDDSVMVPIGRHSSFGSGRKVPWSDLPMPPPPIRSIVNFTPPIEKR